ncbi:hypothetical protein HO133_007376 [Letharia lupina]|uniref:Uncharacterized protein n=1 Tax=Letharia lupina TaxID=560253 RepID=A0A8H6KYN9_9LECA|nr:uncharacterized protein HO133_007376 [Letharia lupina]KAF6229260.1 hypothetical protein HO133_007376 [Letharia lupina]
MFTREGGSTSTAVILSSISTSCLTINPQGSTVFETLGLFTRSNGSVATKTLSSATDLSSLALSIPVTGKSSSTASITTSYQGSVTGASRTNTGPGAASMIGAARTNTTNVKSALFADSSSRISSFLRNAQNAPVPDPDQTSSSRSVGTLSAAMVSVNTPALLPWLQSPGAHAASPLPIIQSTSETRQPAAEIISASPSAQSGLSWSHVAGGSVPASDAALAEILTAALLGQQLSTITTVPPGMVVQSITTSTKCSHAFALASTTSSGSTVVTVVPKICRDDAAFLLFAGAAIPLLCKTVLSLLAFLLRWICDPRTGKLVGIDDITILPPSPAVGAGSAEGSPPNPKDDPQSEDDEPTNSRNSSDHASSTSFPSTNRRSSTMTSSASSAVTGSYYLFGGVGDEDEVSDLLGALNSKCKALQPAVGSTRMSAADWVNINLTDDEVAYLRPNPDVLLITPYISLTESASVTGNEVSTSASFSTLSSYSSTTLSTLCASSASSESSFPSGFFMAKIRRLSPSHQIRGSELSPREHNNTERVLLTKRDPGRNILAQYGSDKMPCPRDWR